MGFWAQSYTDIFCQHSEALIHHLGVSKFANKESDIV